MLSVSSQRKYNFYHQNTLLDAFRMNSRNAIGRNPSMVIPLLANQDLTPMLVPIGFCLFCYSSKSSALAILYSLFTVYDCPRIEQLLTTTFRGDFIALQPSMTSMFVLGSFSVSNEIPLSYLI